MEAGAAGGGGPGVSRSGLEDSTRWGGLYPVGSTAKAFQGRRTDHNSGGTTTGVVWKTAQSDGRGGGTATLGGASSPKAGTAPPALGGRGALESMMPSFQDGPRPHLQVQESATGSLGQG